MTAGFHRRQGQLWAEGMPLDDLARRHGTPLYVYSRAAIMQALGRWRDGLRDGDLLCYAVKANSNLAILQMLAECGCGFDIVSLGELERVIRAGGDPRRMVFSGVGKRPDELRRALQLDIHCINVESAAELDMLGALAQQMGTRARIALRINPHIKAGGHPHLATATRDGKFGIAAEDAPALYGRAASHRGLQVLGIACHLGSQILDLQPLLRAASRLLAISRRLQGDGITLAHIDMGGGLGVAADAPHPRDYLARLHEILGARRLIVAPGRSLVADAGILLSRTLLIKPGFAILDAAMNDFMRPALYQAQPELSAVAPAGAPAQTMHLAGPVCESADCLARDCNLALDGGELVAVHQAGAYGFCMASNYNSRPRPAEVLVDGEHHHLVRRREDLEDLWRDEQMLAGERP